MNELELRIGDSEREQAAAALGDHFAEGRLSVEEHGERLDAIWAARTRGDLRPIFRDLPGPYAAPPAPERPSGRDGYWAAGPRALRARVRTPLTLVLALLLVVSLVTHLPLVFFGMFAIIFVASRRRAAARRRHW